jgi:uncharacterized protein
MAITLTFHGDLPALLRRKWRNQEVWQLQPERAASVKDVVESFGLPHTEVGKLLVDGREVDFDSLIQTSCHIEIRPITAPWDVLHPCRLRSRPLPRIRFLVDVNVSKLGRLLRMAGFDAAIHRHWDDSRLAAASEEEERLLLSKSRGLLMRRRVRYGRCIRATTPPEQLREVITLLALHDQMQPLSRCMECNSLLKAVARDAIDHLLEPLTRKYYSDFLQCPGCARIYWHGSHVKKMLALLPDGAPG